MLDDMYYLPYRNCGTYSTNNSDTYNSDTNNSDTHIYLNTDKSDYVDHEYQYYTIDGLADVCVRGRAYESGMAIGCCMSFVGYINALMVMRWK